MASARENDLNPDIRIGLELPFARSRTGLFGLTETTLEQAGDNINNDIKEAISDAMSNWLPYINISNVNVIENETNLNQMKVSIDFSLNYDPNRFNTITLDIEGE